MTGIDAAQAGDVLSFTVNRFRNPYNALETSGYVIYTADSDGYLINYSADLGVQSTTAAALASVSLTNSEKTVGLDSIYSLRFSLNLPADAGCRLKIYVPDDFTTTTISQVRGFTMFTGTSFQTSSSGAGDGYSGYITKDGCDTYIHSSSTSETIFLTSVTNMLSQRDSAPFKVEFYATKYG